MSDAALLCPACRVRAVLDDKLLKLAKRIASGKNTSRMVHLCPECTCMLVYEPSAHAMRLIRPDEIECLPEFVLRGLRVQALDILSARRRAVVN